MGNMKEGETVALSAYSDISIDVLKPILYRAKTHIVIGQYCAHCKLVLHRNHKRSSGLEEAIRARKPVGRVCHATASNGREAIVGGTAVLDTILEGPLLKSDIDGAAELGFADNCVPLPVG